MAYIYPEDKNAIAEPEEVTEEYINEQAEKLMKEEEDAKITEDEEAKMGDDENEEDWGRGDREKASTVYNGSVWNNVIRSKGFIYVASQAQSIFTWQSAGMMCEVKHLGKWTATGTKDELYAEGHKEEYDSWKDKVQGDRKNQLVIIGSGLDREGITKSLDDCLISVEQYEKMKKEFTIENMVIDNEEEDPFRPIKEMGSEGEQKETE